MRGAWPGGPAGAATATARLVVAAPPELVWRRLTDWPAQTRWVPLTVVRRLPGPVGAVGERFSGRTGLGPLAFEDPMEVVSWRPPAEGRAGRCDLLKHGRLVRGGASIVVRGAGGGTSAVEWTESVSLVSAPLTRPFALPLRWATRLAFGRVLRAMAREVAAERA
ncbi:SRPBCC family protein [Kineococcus glutinatus]|uniref:Polyketide cyclase/dehydrase/lipid transport protein n=1 Tax=Kineococcus glutinatus TaxID=1070872 RepID=A0ABP8VDM3_9ACTN